MTTQVNLVLPAPGSAIQHGHTTVSAGNVAVQIASGEAGCITVAVKALAANADPVYVGSSTASIINAWELSAGESIEIDLDHADQSVWVNSLTVPQSVCWMILQK